MDIARFFFGFNIFDRIDNTYSGGHDVWPPEMVDGIDGGSAGCADSSPAAVFP
jgi:hypothetical protein